MGFPTRITTWSAGDTLAAANLNAEFNIAINALSDGTKDANVAALTASSATVTNNATVGGNATVTGAMTANTVVTPYPKRIGDIYNLGMTLSGGLLSFTDISGAALSSTNYATVVMANATGGICDNIKIATPITIRDDSNATSDFSSLTFGVTAAQHWAQDVPIFIYVVNKGGNAVADADGNSAICLSRNPAMRVTPAAGYIAKKGPSLPSGTDDQYSIVLCGSTYTVANYAALPVQLIGCVRMQWSTTTDDWTFQTLSSTTDGIGEDALRRCFATTWTFPVAQMGAGSGSYFNASGGTVPVFSNNTYFYTIDREGFCTIHQDSNGDAGTDGSGANVLNLYAPYKAATAISAAQLSLTGRVTNPTYDVMVVAYVTSNASTINVFIPTLSGAALQNDIQDMTNAQFSNGSREVEISGTYKAF